MSANRLITNRIATTEEVEDKILITKKYLPEYVHSGRFIFCWLEFLFIVYNIIDKKLNVLVHNLIGKLTCTNGFVSAAAVLKHQ